MKIKRYRSVPPLHPVIHEDAYDYLFRNNPEVLIAVEEAVEDGFSPKEIYYDWIREAGDNRGDLAKRCENAAKHIMSQSVMT